MIRPLTCICMLLAGGSGLYLYETKHRTRMLDHQIEQTLKQVEATRSRLGILQAEWALLNEPQRLAELADRFLNLKPVAPTQFVTLSDLNQHLPAPLPPPAATASTAAPAEPASAPEPAQVAAPAEPAQSTRPAQMATNAVPTHSETARARPAAPARTAPLAEPPAPRPVALASARATEPPAPARHAQRREPVAQPVAEAAVSAPLVRPVVTPVLALASPRPRPVVVSAVPAEPVARVIGGRAMMTTAAPSANGSLLGGAHAAMAPPVPMSDATAWPPR